MSNHAALTSIRLAQKLNKFYIEIYQISILMLILTQNTMNKSPLFLVINKKAGMWIKKVSTLISLRMNTLKHWIFTAGMTSHLTTCSLVLISDLFPLPSLSPPH